MTDDHAASTRFLHKAAATDAAKMLVFGAGGRGLEALGVLAGVNARVLGFLDNDPAKHGVQCAGLPVAAPQALDRFDYDYIVVASLADYEITRQLESLGVPAERILHYPGAERPDADLLYYADIAHPERVWDVLSVPVNAGCNLMCAHCARVPEHREDDWTMSLETFDGTLARLDPERFRMMLLSGHGEITIISDLADYMETARAHGFKNIFFHTNGAVLRPDLYERLIRDRLADGAIISVEAVSPDRYRRFRGQDISRMQRYLDTCNRLKRSHDSPFLLSFNVTCLRENLPELPAIVDYAADNGVHHITFIHLNTFFADENPPEGKLCIPSQRLHNVERSQVVETFRDVLERAQRHGVEVRLPEPFPELESVQAAHAHPRISPTGYACDMPFKWVMVGPEGEVYPCCQSMAKLVMGSLKEQPLEELVRTSTQYDALLKGLLPGAEPDPVCKACGVLQGNSF